jgi:hypothetical protein
LRDEFFMADEAFALSPISARATLPGEADYDAISAAFMETSRGRWFLSEYAKRNRNADTRMVLDAVARIEENLAARKDAAPDNKLPGALAALRQAMDEARAAAMAGAVAEERLAPIRGGARVIRETLLRLREIGADGRIYDLMDSQVGAIEAGCEQLASTDAEAALNAAFDLIEQRIRGFEGDDTEQPPSFEASSVPSATAAASETVSPSDAAPEAAAASPSEPFDADAAHDDAVLDMIALEMAAPDFAESVADEFSEPDPVEPVSVAKATEPAIAPPPEPASIPQPSLGASLIANGIVRRPDPSATDPLAPIRRMSQAEKIAFFS